MKVEHYDCDRCKRPFTIKCEEMAPGDRLSTVHLAHRSPARKLEVHFLDRPLDMDRGDAYNHLHICPGCGDSLREWWHAVRPTPPATKDDDFSGAGETASEVDERIKAALTESSEDGA